MNTQNGLHTTRMILFFTTLARKIHNFENNGCISNEITDEFLFV